MPTMGLPSFFNDGLSAFTCGFVRLRCDQHLRRHFVEIGVLLIRVLLARFVFGTRLGFWIGEGEAIG